LKSTVYKYFLVYNIHGRLGYLEIKDNIIIADPCNYVRKGKC